MSTNEYKKSHYDSILIRIPKGGKEILLQLAKEKGLNTTQLIVQALEKQYGLYLGRDKP